MRQGEYIWGVGCDCPLEIKDREVEGYPEEDCDGLVGEGEATLELTLGARYAPSVVVSDWKETDLPANLRGWRIMESL
jgi:hypothetical protein